jgi:spore maturation protein B
MILSPVSGSGAITIFESILKDFGPDSFIGRTASVMMGSTETTFYATTLYYGSCKIKKTRHTLPCAICADIVSFIFSARAVELFLE